MASPTVTWSLMHPTPIDPEYFRRVADAADASRVDSFEICGDCHGPLGGLDGLYDYADYGSVLSPEQLGAIGENRRRLNEILGIARARAKPVLLWHREVVLPDTLTDQVPGLLDEDGAFDFFGDAFAELVRRKIRGALHHCPDMDGMVLTLTEAQHSVIHPADPERYPPEQVVAHIALLFAETLRAHGKTFVLRSFGSTERDYEILLAGAERAAKRVSFEIETKVTPYDFIPFFDHNPFLRRTGGCALSVEFDGLGEFLGAGYFPAAGVEDLLRRVRDAQAAGADRFSLRIDRTGHSLLDRSYAIKTGVCEAAARGGVAAGRNAYRKWLAERAPGHAEALGELFETGWQATLKTLYLGGNLICHTNPVAPQLKWIKAGGFFGVLHGSGDLSNLRLIWSILADRPGLSREELLAEKAEALRLADEGRKQLEALRECLDPSLFETLDHEWANLEAVAPAMDAFVRFCEAALSGLQSLEDRRRTLADQLARYREKFASAGPESGASVSATIEHDLFRAGPAPVREAWLRPLAAIMEELLAEYPAELELRRELSRDPDNHDYLVPGGIADDWRVGRHMHASHAFFAEGRLRRAVGNALFPDGFVDLHLRLPPEGGELRLATDGSAKPQVELGGETLAIAETDDGYLRAPLPAQADKSGHPVRVRRATGGELYLLHVAVRRSSAKPHLQNASLSPNLTP